MNREKEFNTLCDKIESLMYGYKSKLEQKQCEIVWKHSLFEVPNNISY